MNMFKKNGGFTLVELIVVIAILAILAGVAIPAYSGYIAKANDSACLSELTAIQNAAQAACSLEGTELSAITINAGEIALTPALASVSDDVDANFDELYTTTGANLNKILEKHSNYDANTKTVTWTVADGWDLLN